ncbi:EamA-like transporter family-domain-containing protein [Crucibulum laeve]|uniref:EamA-like transporter family-domain-containing protein n=1 Tax=Crucibulum laeve TaxID=68775 RepID=A0A5C3M0B5_9AGAR|nr:EamA-like transporter family-domain-containing protein [Crucibulum laeve]
MSSRTAYTALTPDYADFAIPSSATAAAPPPDSPRGASPFPSDDIYENDEPQSKMRKMYDKVKDGFKANTGLLLVTASQAFLSLMNVAVKKLNNIDPPVGVLELVVVRMVITYLCSIAFMLYANVPDPFIGPKGVRFLLAFRGFSGFFGLFGIYYSLQYLSLSDATVLTFLAPMCTAVAGAVFLKEHVTKKQVFAGIFSLIGVVLIARPVSIFGEAAKPPTDGDIPDSSEKGTPAERLVAVGVALVGVLGSAGAYTSIAAIGKRAHPLHSMMSFSAQCVIVSSIAMIATRTPLIIPTRLDWLGMLVMIGVFGFIAQTLLTMGLQRETAGRGSMAVYTQVIFAGILERIFFRSDPSVLSVFGTLMIIASALYVALTKERQPTPTKKKANAVVLARVNEEAMEEGLLARMNAEVHEGKDDTREAEAGGGEDERREMKNGVKGQEEA